MPSNISAVMGKLERAKTAIPASINSVMQSQRYAARMRYIAGSIMDDGTILTDDERQFIPQLLDTFMHATAAGHMKFSIQMVPIETLIQFVDDASDFLRMEVRDDLLQWVTDYKQKRGRDYYASGSVRSDEDIAERVAFAIQADPEPWLKSTNPNGLRRYLGLTQLPAEKVSAVLREVIQAWVAYMRATLPELMCGEIRRAFK